MAQEAIKYEIPAFEATTKFLHDPTVKTQLQKQHVNWLVRPRQISLGNMLDVVFYQRDEHGTPTLKPVDLFEKVKKCIGICISREGETESQLEDRLRRIEDEIRKNYPDIGDDFTIVTGPEASLATLLPKEAVNREVPGPGVADEQVSTFERILEEARAGQINDNEDTEEETNHLTARVKELLEDEDVASYLTENGIKYLKKGLTNFMFVDSDQILKTAPLPDTAQEHTEAVPKNGHPVRLVNLKNVKLGCRGAEGKLVETLLAETPCAGIYTPDIGQLEGEVLNNKITGPKIQAVVNPDEQKALLKLEVKLRAYEIAENIRRSLVHGMRSKVNFQIAVAMDNQINLWTEMGFLEDMAAQFPDTVPPRDVIKFLFFDEEQKREGPLSKMGITFRTQSPLTDGIDFDPDLLFFTKDYDHGSIHPVGLSLWGLGKNFEPTVYNNVHGLILFPTSMSLADRKRYTRQAEQALQHWLGDPMATVMGADANLLEFWKRQGTPVVKEEVAKEISQTMSPKKAIDYGIEPYLNEIDQVSLRFHNPKGLVIGAPMMILKENYVQDPNHPDYTLGRGIGLEMPWAYPVAQALSRFPGRPGPALGLMPFLERDLFPEEPRIYKTDMLKKSLNVISLNSAADPDGHSFIVSELYHRLGWEELRDYIGTRVPQFKEFESLHQQLELREQQIYEKDKTIYDVWEFTHGHTDHIQGGSLIRFDIPFVMSVPTFATQMAAYNSGWNYTTKEGVVEKLRTDKKARPFQKLPVNHRPIKYLHDGEPIIANPFTTITGYSVEHSIPGAMAIMNQIVDQRSGRHATVTNLGDFRRGTMTDRALEELAKHTTSLIIESTNFEEFSRKPSTRISPEQATENIGKEIREADKTGGYVVVQLPTNDIDALQGIIDQAGDRKVVVPYAVAQLLLELDFLNSCQPYEKRIKLPQLGEDVFVFKHSISSYKPWQEQFNPISVTPDDVASDPKSFVVLQSPYQLLEKTFKGLRDLKKPAGSNQTHGVVIRSCPWPYNQGDKDIVLANNQFLKSINFDFKTDIDLSHNRIGYLDDDKIVGYHASGHLRSPEEYLEVLAMFITSGNLRQIIPIHTNIPGLFGDKSQELIDYLKTNGIATTDIEVVKKMRRSRRMIDIPIPFS